MRDAPGVSSRSFAPRQLRATGGVMPPLRAVRQTLLHWSPTCWHLVRLFNGANAGGSDSFPVVQSVNGDAGSVSNINGVRLGWARGEPPGTQGKLTEDPGLRDSPAQKPLATAHTQASSRAETLGLSRERHPRLGGTGVKRHVGELRPARPARTPRPCAPSSPTSGWRRTPTAVASGSEDSGAASVRVWQLMSR